jgi:hypothetical protein
MLRHWERRHTMSESGKVREIKRVEIVYCDE